MVDIVEYILFVAAFQQFGGVFLMLAYLLEIILAGLLRGLKVK